MYEANSNLKPLLQPYTDKVKTKFRPLDKNHLFACLLLYVPSQQLYGHGGTVSSPKHTFPGQA